LESKPEVIVELGTNIGYSSILMAMELSKIHDSNSKIYTFEMDETLFDISLKIIKMSGLDDLIVQILGKANGSLHRLQDEYLLEKIDLLFIDHWKFFYLPDLRIIETLGLISIDTIIIADNVIKPGIPDYLEYVKSPPIFKNEFNRKITNINGHHYPGKFGLLYESQTKEGVNGIGEKDGVEITKCIGILDA